MGKIMETLKYWKYKRWVKKHFVDPLAPIGYRGEQ